MPPPAPEQPTPPRARGRRWLLWLALLLAFALALALAARALLPLAVARAIETAAARTLGLPVAVGNVDLQLLGAAVVVEDVRVGRGPSDESDRIAEVLRLERLSTRFYWRPLLRRELHVRELVLETPALLLERLEDGRLRIPGIVTATEQSDDADGAPPFRLERFVVRDARVRLLAPGDERELAELQLGQLAATQTRLEQGVLVVSELALSRPVLRVARGAPGRSGAAPQPAAAPADRAAPTFRIERLSLEGGRLALLDDDGLQLEIRLDAEQVNDAPRQAFPLTLELGAADGTLAAEGQLGLAPAAFDGQIRWRDLSLPALAATLRPAGAAWLRSCRTEGELTLATRDADEGPGLRAAGRLRVTDLSLEDPESKELSLSWDALELDLEQLLVPLAPEAGEGLRATVERARIEAPSLRYTRPGSALERLRAAWGAGEASEAAPDPAQAGPEIVLRSLELEGAELRFVDQGVSPAYRTRLRDLQLGMRDLHWPKVRAPELRLEGSAPEQAAFRISGFLAEPASEFGIEIERLALAPLQPYAAQAGYQLQRGEASLEAKLRIAGGRVETSNELVLHQLRVSSGGEGYLEQQLGMSLDLMLALLRDPGGDIQLSVPLTFEQGAARTSLAPILRDALQQAVLGALTTPLKLVGAVLPTGRGAGRPGVDPLHAVTGLADPDPQDRDRLTSLGNLLEARPTLGVVLRGRVGVADRTALARRKLVDRALAGEPLPGLEAGGEAATRLREVLTRLGRGETVLFDPDTEALLARSIAAVTVSEPELEALARRRAERVREALIRAHEIEPERIEVGAPAPQGDPAVLVELAAEPG